MLFVPFIGRIFEVTEVAGNAGDAKNAAFLVHIFVHSCIVQTLFLHQDRNDCRIDGAAAGAHEDPIKRREAHGRIHGFAAINSGDGRPIAQMASNDLGIFRFLAKKLSGTGSYIAMARTMKPYLRIPYFLYSSYLTPYMKATGGMV